MSKTCTSCNKTYLKPEKHFNKDKSRKDGLTFYCKECSREITQYYEDKKKKPLITKTCAYSKCNNTFETRIYKKKYCCQSHASLSYQEDKIGKDLSRFRANYNKKLRRKKEEKPNGGKKWTEKEIKILFKKREKGATFREIAEILGRSYESCGNKYRDLRNRIVAG